VLATPSVRLLWVSAALSGAVAVACLNDPVTPNPSPTPTPIGATCTPASEGYVAATPLEAPRFSLPVGCDVLVDPATVAVFRRQVIEIVDPEQLRAACHLGGADAGVPVALDAGAAREIDFAAYKLLVVRVPETQNFRWIVTRGREVVIGESTTVCAGIRADAVRYARLVPRTSSVSFHLCRPAECGDDE
jgi:hypothetical protein